MKIDWPRRATGKRHGGAVRFVLSHDGWNPLVDVCDVCGEAEDDTDLLQLTNIRFRKNLCRSHFRDALVFAKTGTRVQPTP